MKNVDCSAPDWVRDAVFYQIFPDRFAKGNPERDTPGLAVWGDTPTRDNFFGGDLRGILHRVDYLQDLGVNAIYLNPIFLARTNHRYDTCDYFKVDPMLGDLEDLRSLVGALHRRDMHIILDGVFNHCGDGFPAFVDFQKNGAASDYVNWFTARSFPVTQNPVNYLSCGGCHYLPKLNHAYRPVQELIFKVARYWLDQAGIDGWRLDVPFKISFDFWREFRQVVKSTNPQAYLVGEVWREAGPWVQGDIFDGVTNYRLRDLLLDYVNTRVLDGEDFGFELQALLNYHGNGADNMLNLLDSHDTARILTQLMGDIDLLKIALTAQMTLPGAPMVYYGDEVGLLGETDPDCRRCFPWDKSAWNEKVYSFTRELIAVRKAHPALRRARPQTLAAFNGIYAYRMAIPEDEVMVVLNPREAIGNMSFPATDTAPAWKDILTGKIYPVIDHTICIDPVPAKSVLVLLPERSYQAGG